MYFDLMETCLLNPNNDEVDLDIVNALLDVRRKIETDRWMPYFEELHTLTKFFPSSV